MPEIQTWSMISRLKGIIAIKQPTMIILDVNGIGFELRVPLSTSSRLPNQGACAQLFVFMEVSRAGVELFGFDTEEQLTVFRQLTAVKGVGPKAALNLLSRFEPAEILAAIRRQDIQLLRSVPGIGEKKASELIMKLSGSRPETAEQHQLTPDVFEQAVNALESLGLKRKEALQRLKRLHITPETTLPELLKQALALQD
ncbi:MAG: Holliday junction branch migration protein RuvA [candidate division WOR-3 bacterium]